MTTLTKHPSRRKIVEAARLRSQGATQKEAAEAVGVSTRTVRRWESEEELWETAIAAADREPDTDRTQDSEPDTEPDTPNASMAVPARTEPRDTCNANTRKGTPCQRPAGWGTDHAGIGRCKLHGGATPVKHGRYSTVKQQQLAGLIQEMEEDPAPLDVLPELATARALLKDFLDRYDELVEALLEWNRAEHAESEKRKARPQRIPELRDALPLVSEVSKIVKRVQDIRSQDALSRPELVRIYSEMWRAVLTETDPETAERIGRLWTNIHL